MIARLLIALCLAAPASAFAAPSDRARIEPVIQLYLDGEFAKDVGIVRDATWPEGYLVSTVEGPMGSTFRRHWDNLNFGGIGISNRTRMARPAIRVDGNRAIARFRSTTRTYYSLDYSGMYSLSRNRVELERRRGEWRVLNWYRRSRSYGSDAAWQRRHPR